MEERHLICIGCPVGCALTVKTEQGAVISVEGNTCKRPCQNRYHHGNGNRWENSRSLCKNQKRYSKRKNL